MAYGLLRISTLNTLRKLFHSGKPAHAQLTSTWPFPNQGPTQHLRVGISQGWPQNMCHFGLLQVDTFGSTEHRGPKGEKKKKRCFFSMLFSTETSLGPQHNSAPTQQMIQDLKHRGNSNSLLDFIRIVVWLITWNSVGLG